ncbi:hypothetical protein SNEBB_001715 [Seison nebaliae]|nr:hypothetical protein SNEBB_001715 [Seison nebaliae]
MASRFFRWLSRRGSNNPAQHSRNKKSNKNSSPSISYNNDEIICSVTYLDDKVIQFKISRRSNGEQLLMKVFYDLDIMEKEYFGLQYLDEYNIHHWLDREKLIKKQCTIGPPYCFRLKVKFFPSKKNQLKYDMTKYLFVLQLRKEIYEKRLNNEQKIDIASLLLQTEHGDYDAKEFSKSFINDHDFFNDDGMNEDLSEEIIKKWKLLKNLVPSECDKNFIDKCFHLDWYGVDMHTVIAKDNNTYHLGLTPNGLLIYQNNEKLGLFAWSKIVKIEFKKQQFTICCVEDDEMNKNVMIPKKQQEYEFIFRSVDEKSCKHLWKSCVEFHSFYRLAIAPVIENPTTSSTSAFGDKKRNVSRRLTDRFNEPTTTANNNQSFIRGRYRSTQSKNHKFQSASTNTNNSNPNKLPSTARRSRRQSISAFVRNIVRTKSSHHYKGRTESETVNFDQRNRSQMASSFDRVPSKRFSRRETNSIRRTLQSSIDASFPLGHNLDPIVTTSAVSLPVVMQPIPQTTVSPSTDINNQSVNSITFNSQLNISHRLSKIDEEDSKLLPNNNVQQQQLNQIRSDKIIIPVNKNYSLNEDNFEVNENGSETTERNIPIVSEQTMKLQETMIDEEIDEETKDIPLHKEFEINQLYEQQQNRMMEKEAEEELDKFIPDMAQSTSPIDLMDECDNEERMMKMNEENVIEPILDFINPINQLDNQIINDNQKMEKEEMNINEVIIEVKSMISSSSSPSSSSSSSEEEREDTISSSTKEKNEIMNNLKMIENEIKETRILNENHEKSNTNEDMFVKNEIVPIDTNNQENNRMYIPSAIPIISIKTKSKPVNSTDQTTRLPVLNIRKNIALPSPSNISSSTTTCTIPTGNSLNRSTKIPSKFSIKTNENRLKIDEIKISSISSTISTTTTTTMQMMDERIITTITPNKLEDSSLPSVTCIQYRTGIPKHVIKNSNNNSSNSRRNSSGIPVSKIPRPAISTEL